jgi:hypothetical protein
MLDAKEAVPISPLHDGSLAQLEYFERPANAATELNLNLFISGGGLGN